MNLGIFGISTCQSCPFFMSHIIQIFADGARLRFGRGSFDQWCVYLFDPGRRRWVAPRDTEYFGRLFELSKKHGAASFYRDFVQVYEFTTAAVEKHQLERIRLLSNKYGSDSLEIQKWLTVIYAGMVAEENKANAVLKKRVKRLGMHQVLVQGMPADVAANFSKGKSWQYLDQICRANGF
jgi:hypothetical protein